MYSNSSLKNKYNPPTKKYANNKLKIISINTSSWIKDIKV